MKKRYLIFPILLFFVAQPCFSQDRLPAWEYTNPSELIAISEEVPFQDALSILEEISIEVRDKIFINQSTYQGPIGINIPQMHWMDALNYITAHNNLYFREYDRYIEILDAPTTTGALSASTDPGVAEIVDRINFQTREIEISATFFQGSRQLIRELGIDWTSLNNDKVRISSAGASNVSQQFFEAEVNFLDILNSGWDINALFNAFETTDNGEIIASPTIKVVDGEEGFIQVGQDFSIKQRDFAGNVTDQFFETGTILRVTPRVLVHEGTPYVYMTVAAERSTASPDPVSTIINKTEANSEILLLSGESTVIAGLYETDVQKTRRGIPILKDLPGWFLGLRYLFGYESTSSSVQELVILIKATLLPTLEERLAAPLITNQQLLQERRTQFEEELNNN
tara:strand:+ start:51801 stop:52994 length:1194 start_codon:yes stop_codon:yes gene_type:complete